MGLFNQITPPEWQGSTTAKTTERQSLNWKPRQVGQIQPVSLGGWQAYNPQQAQSAWNWGQQTPYAGVEQNAIAQLANIIQYGGYSPEQKQTMYTGMMAPVQQQAEEARRQAEADAYSRGLGQSGVLSRSYGDIDQQLLASGQQARGQIEAQGAAQVLPAIQAIQQGQQNLQQMGLQQALSNAQLAQQREALASQLSLGSGELAAQMAQTNAQIALGREELATQLNMHQGDLERAIDQINATLDMSDADRQLELQRIMNQFNLDTAQLEMVQNEAKKDRWANFFGNLIGGGATVAGAALGAK